MENFIYVIQYLSSTIANSGMGGTYGRDVDAVGGTGCGKYHSGTYCLA